MSADKMLSNIEAILSEIEKLDAATSGQFREASDREAYDICCRIERRMLSASGDRTDVSQGTDLS